MQNEAAGACLQANAPPPYTSPAAFGGTLPKGEGLPQFVRTTFIQFEIQTSNGRFVNRPYEGKLNFLPIHKNFYLEVYPHENYL